MIDLKILDKQFIKEFGLPNYATKDSGAIDLRANLTPYNDLNIHPDETCLLGTGIAIHINRPDVLGMIVPRSGLGHKKGLVLGNGTEIIDSDYTQQIFISCWNRSDNIYTINRGDRIAQLIFVPIIVQVEFNIVENFEKSNRDGGFGHNTGIK